MTAFQPFAGTERVDFDALGRGGLFLMQGETGAGKTAILDAICFALFGHVPGPRDTAGRLRSDHGSARDRTQVELELTLSGRRLRVTRSPKQERNKVRGAGVTEEPARALLEVADPDEGWSVLADRVDAVEHELRPLLGLTLGQFCQVVLLPQGAFARFLHATSDEREKILQQLFSTDRYAAAETWLTDQRQAADAALRRGLERVADIASRVAQVAEEEPPAGWREEPERLAAWVQGRTVLADADEAAAEGTRDAAVAARDRAAAALAQAQALAEAQARHARARLDLKHHRAAQAARDQAAERMGAARRAEPAAVLARAAEQAARRAERARHLAAQELESACGQLAPVALAEVDAEEARERAAGLREQAAVARGLLELEHRLALDREALGRLRAALDGARRQAQGRRDWLFQAVAVRTRLLAAAETARAARAALPGLSATEDRARASHAAAQRRDELAAQIQGARSRVEEARADENRSRQAWLDARERRLEGIAVELAGELRDGEPCRVCGSRDHPGPAEDHEGERVDAATEERLAERVRRCSELLERVRVAAAELERERAGAVAVSGEASRETLHEALRRARDAAQEGRGIAQGAEAAERELADHELRLAETERAARQDGERIAALSSELRAGEQVLIADTDTIDRARVGAPTISARVEALQHHAEGWGRAARALDDAAVTEQQATQRAEEAGAEAAQCGFASTVAALAAALAPEEILRLTDAVQAFDARLEWLRATAEDPDLLAASQQPAPDELVAADALRSAEDEYGRGQSEHALACRRARELRKLAGELDERLIRLAPLIDRRGLVAGVAGLVDGSSAANRLRMPLAAYVLTARLEQIAEAASQRLERMSGGRYLLLHCDERIGRSRKAGLGLQVLDAWTGRERPPSSLSGGETFQASLALALGLADVVSAESGAARLETLFVDEGFGSLGDRALDDVLDVLDGLREGGRSVGVISHVAELRQRIPTALHVDKQRGGSRIRQRGHG